MMYFCYFFGAFSPKKPINLIESEQCMTNQMTSGGSGKPLVFVEKIT